MKKTLLLLASVALLLVGCQKENFVEQLDGTMTEATFTASVDGGVATKAAVDGNGLYVNRCIMEIYFQDQLYKRMVQKSTDGLATFANVPVVAGKQYQILFWADHVDNPDEAEGLATDKYYDTNGQEGLKAVKVLKESFIEALSSEDDAKTNDYLDAFFFADNYTISQNQTEVNAVVLKRPFAQLNVITTDVAAGRTVTSAALLPDKVSVSYKADNTINVATGETSKVGQTEADYTFAYEAPVYGSTTDWDAVKTRGELTLSMDYILASTEQAAVDVTFKTFNNGDANPVMTHSLTNLPYKRNYRTNVKGDLLTVGGTWTATIDADWLTPDIVKVVEVADIKSANEIINQYKETTDHLEVKFTAEPNDSGVPTGEQTSPSRAIVTTPIKEESVLSIEVLAQTKSLYVGDYTNEYTVTSVDTENAKHAVVNINVPESSSIVKLVINAPSKSVYINGKAVANVGTITDLDAITSQNTLIIEKGQTVNKLTIRQGGLEIHGTVSTLVISENDHDNSPVKVRTSENLSQAVFGVIYQAGDGGHDFIDRPDFSERQNANGTWDIVPSVCKITETGKAYGTVADAFKAVENGQTIVMLQNDVLTKGQTITLENSEAFTLDLNGKTISIAETGFDFTANGTNAALRDGVPVRFAIVVNGVGTMTICDNSVDKLGRLETKNNSYGTTKTILVDGNAIVNVNGGTVSADYAAFYVIGDTKTGDDAFIPSLNISGGKIIGQQIGIGLKGKTATVTVTGGEIVGEKIYGISTNGTTDWYDGGNCRIIISGGKIKSTDGLAMYLPAEAITEITGGTIEGSTGIGVKGGSLSISGDAVVKAVGQHKEDAHAVSSGCSETGSCIYVEDTYENHSPIVNISGGKFSSASFKSVEYFTNKATEATNKGKITLIGGIYSDAPDASFVAEGYAVLDNTDAATKAEYPKTVKVKPVVKIGDVEYADIADAFAAVPTDGTPKTVTLLENIGSKTGDVINWKEYAKTSVYKIKDGQNITFDLNGHKIYAKTTVTGYTCFFEVVNGGSLTFMDSAGGGELHYLDGMDNTGGLAIISYGTLIMQSGTVENHTKCNSSAIQGAIDVRANEWGAQYQYHSVFTMNGGVLKSNGDNTLRIYDSSQTGTGSVVVDFEINDGEIYGADAVFIMPSWTKDYSTGEKYMNQINVSVKGGSFDTTNGIRVYGIVKDDEKSYKAIKINVSGGVFKIHENQKHRVNYVAFQNSENRKSTQEDTQYLVSYTEVNWTAAAPTYSAPVSE